MYLMQTNSAITQWKVEQQTKTKIYMNLKYDFAILKQQSDNQITQFDCTLCRVHCLCKTDFEKHVENHEKSVSEIDCELCELSFVESVFFL